MSNLLTVPFVRKTLPTLVFFSFFAVSAVASKEVYAQKVWGSHAYCWANETVFNLIWTTYCPGGECDWYPVTVMIGVDGGGVDNLKALFANATSNGKKLYPMLRLTSQGGANWSKIQPDVASSMLGAVVPNDEATKPFPGPIYVSFGNETHMAGEWDGMTDPSTDYWSKFKTFADAMAGNGNYVVGHAGVNLSYPIGADGDTAEEFYYIGKVSGSLGKSATLFSNPYELSGAGVGFPGTRHMPGTLLSIPNHVAIDRWYNRDAGGSNSPNIWMEFGLDPGQPISSRAIFLEDAYTRYPAGNYKYPEINPSPEAITPMLMSDTEKNIVIYKNAGGISYIQCSGTGCGQEICAGGSARNNPTNIPRVISGGVGGGVTELTCSDGMYELTITGTIKSSKSYTQSFDPLTDKTVYTPYRYGDPITAPVVTKLPVKGAFVQMHHSYREKSNKTVRGNYRVADQNGGYGSTETVWHEFNSGLFNGMFKQSYVYYKTGSDGTFSITAKSHCGDVYRKDFRGTGYEQFFSISCPSQPEGRNKGLYSVENYIVVLNSRHGTDASVVNLGDINVDCEYDPEGVFGLFNPDTEINADLNADGTKYIYRNRDVYMSCSGSGLRDLGDGGEAHSVQVGARSEDEFSSEDPNRRNHRSLQAAINFFRQLIINTLEDMGVRIPFGFKTGASIENRMEIQQQDFDLANIRVPIEFFTGFRGGDVKTAEFKRLDGGEQPPEVYSCEQLRRGNTSVVFEEGYQNENTQTSGGVAFNLAPPYGGTVLENGVVDYTASVLLPRWLDTGKDRVICKTDVGEEIKIRDIMPPQGLCGDIDSNGRLEGIELSIPCPEFYTCGDEDINGVLDSWERDCFNVKVQTPGGYENPGRYKLDSRYFPYFSLFVLRTKPLAEEESRKLWPEKSSYWGSCPRGYFDNEEYIPSEGEGGDSKPMNTVCKGGPTSDNFHTQEAVKIPGVNDNKTNFGTSYNINTIKGKTYPLPAMSVGTPQFINATDPREILEKSLSGMVSSLSLKNRVNITRIGTPSNLCTCSLVEMRGNRTLGSCASEDAPNPKEPSNLFNSTKDEGPGNPSYVNIKDPVANPSQEASRTAGGGKWNWWGTNDGSVNTWSQGGKTGATNVDESNDAYYSQDIKSPFNPRVIYNTIAELVNCNPRVDDINGREVEEHNDVDNPDLVTGTHWEWDDSNPCSRVVEWVAQALAITGWQLPKYEVNSAVFYESIFPPDLDNTDLDHLRIRSASLENLAMTKPQQENYIPATDSTDMPGSEGSGYAIDRGDDLAMMNSLTSNLVNSPVWANSNIDGVGGSSPRSYTPISPPPPPPTPRPPGSPGFVGTGGICNAGCASCYQLAVSVSCGGITATNTSPDVWGDVSVEFKVPGGGSVVMDGPRNLLPNNTMFVGGPGRGTFEYNVNSNSAGCQGGGGAHGTITC